MTTTTARRPVNKRMVMLESAAEKVARSIAIDRDIKVIVSGMMAAYNWKHKTLHLPAYSQEPDDPQLCAAHRGTLSHELSHVLFTDFDLAEQRIEAWEKEFKKDGAQRAKHLWNVFEDPWIQVAYAKEYRGAKYHFDQMELYIHEKTGGAQATDPNYVPPGGKRPVGVFGALAQAILRTGPGPAQISMDDVHAEIRPLMEQLKDEIELGRKAYSTKEALDAGEAVWRKLKQIAESEPRPENEAGDDEDKGEQEGEPGEGKPSKKGKPKKDPSGKESGEGDPSATGEDGEAGEGEEEGSAGGAGEEGEPGEGAEEEGEGSGAGEAGDPAEGGGAPGEGKPKKEDKRTAAQKAVEGEHSEIDRAKVAAGVGQDEESPAGAHGSGEGEEQEGPTPGAGGPESNAQTQEPAEHSPGGAGGGGPAEVPREKAATAIGGDWGEVPETNRVIAADFLHEIPPQYTVHPAAAARDRLVQYSQLERSKGRDKLELLERTAGPAVKKLQSYLTGAFQASRQALVIGGMEDGDEIDEGAIPGIALGSNDRAIFTTTVRAVEESSFVTILVDCSGSMQRSDPYMTPTGPKIVTKSGYAAVTAMAIHQALSALRVPHGVLGYSTREGYGEERNTMRPDGYLTWSRQNRSLEMHEFVPAPGISDDGAALPYITGMQWNLDGESVLYAAKYAATHGGAYDRVILLVIADGLPAGADDGRIEGAYLKQVVQKVSEAQIEVYGIGVCIEDWNVFRSYYPDSKGGGGKAPTGAMQIKAQEGLTDNVLRELTRLLTRGYGTTRKGGQR